MRAEIHLVVRWPDGRRTDVEMPTAFNEDTVTPAMLDAAEDLIRVLATGERVLPKDLYDVCSRAFGTTRDDAKKRLLAAMFGTKCFDPEPLLIGWTWRAHLDDLYADVRAKQWLRVTKKLALMLNHALDEIRENGKERMP